MSERRTHRDTSSTTTEVSSRRAATARPRHRLPKTSILVLASLALIAAACEFNPAALTANRAWSECLGEQATIGHGWNPLADPPEGVSYEGTEGDDVVVITNGPVTFDGLGGNDLICINDTGLGSPGPVVIDAGDGDDQVWDRRHRHGTIPSHVVLDVVLGDGDDRFWGSAANDIVDAGPGADEVNGGGGLDDVDCGDGTDLRWTGDHTNPATVATDCENTDQGHGPVDERAVQARLDSFIADVGVPGAQIGVRVPGQPDVIQASGIDDLNADPQTPMPLDGTFHIASVTKTFTSAAVLQLIEEGRLSFDDTLSQWLPEHDHAEAITIRMLLDHTSGVFSPNPTTMEPGAENAFKFGNGPDYAWSFEELMEFTGSYEPAGLPGSGWTYSKANYWALGLIIEQVTGQSVYEVFDHRIFEPYGLDDTVLDDGTATITQHGWWSGVLDFLLVPRTPFMTYATTAGAVVSSTKDLLTWGEVLYGGEFLGDALDAELHSLVHAPWPDDDRYGLGVTGYCPCDDPSSPSVLGHTGSQPGTRTNLRHDSDSGMTVSFRANTEVVDYVDMDLLVRDVFSLVQSG